MLTNAAGGDRGVRKPRLCALSGDVAASAGSFPLGQEGLPLLGSAVEDVAVDMAVDAGGRAVGLILPELPGPAPVFDRRMILRRADPDRVVGECAVAQDRFLK